MLFKSPKLSTILIHIACWMAVLLIPTFSAYQVISSAIGARWIFFAAPILTFSFILISIFYFNYNFLIPRLLFNGKRVLYVLSCVGIVLFVLSVPFIITQVYNYRPEGENPEMARARPLAFSNMILMFIMAYIASIGLATNNRLKQVEKEKLTAQLAYLPAQINPHFLFNTLNGIYAVTIVKAPKAAEMVEKLSDMMRYSLNQTLRETVDLEQETAYIENYIELQKIRFGNSVKVSCIIDTSGKKYQIAPLLLIPFVENAFKHGVNAEEDSEIRIHLSVDEKVLQLDVYNRKVKLDMSTHVKSGLGINNTRNRLQIIYPNKHTLSVADSPNSFSISLQIQLA